MPRLIAIRLGLLFALVSLLSAQTALTNEDLVKLAKAKPGAINFGHAGIGSGTHLNTERFIAASGVKVTEVPFKGTPEVVTALLSNSVDCYWAPISAALSPSASSRSTAARTSTPWVASATGC